MNGNLAELGIFFLGLGVFFMGVGVLWWISLQDREMKIKRRL